MDNAAHTVRIAAPAARLWEMVSDVTRMGEWSPETTGAQWLDGASSPVVGARFKGRNSRGKGRWATVCEVTEADPGHTFAFVVGGTKRPRTAWRYRFTPVDGGTEVTESFEVIKPLGRVPQTLLRLLTGVTDPHAHLADGLRQTLHRLKAAAESQPQQ
ncbi:MAG: SRPBCC family protein [Egibacteraceae bacterium]